MEKLFLWVWLVVQAAVLIAVLTALAVTYFVGPIYP